MGQCFGCRHSNRVHSLNHQSWSEDDTVDNFQATSSKSPEVTKIQTAASKVMGQGGHSNIMLSKFEPLEPNHQSRQAWSEDNIVDDFQATSSKSQKVTKIRTAGSKIKGQGSHSNIVLSQSEPLEPNHRSRQAWPEDNIIDDFQATSSKSPEVTKVQTAAVGSKSGEESDDYKINDHPSVNSCIEACDSSDVDGGGTAVLAHEYDDQNSLRDREELQVVPRQRVAVKPPEGFDSFIRKVIVPTFKSQRRSDQKQFAVLLLVSEKQFSDINQVSFLPSEPSLTDNTQLSMPANEENYHNYIVSRPQNDNYHAEAVILHKLDSLWNGYLSHNDHSPPKCFILYSWNFPCTTCTEKIIESFNGPKYKSVSVLVAGTAYWDKETHDVRENNERKMKEENFCVRYYRGIQLSGNSNVNVYNSDSDDYGDDSSCPYGESALNNDDYEFHDSFDEFGDYGQY